MTLVKCRECRNEISREAETCPQCGAIPFRKKFAGILSFLGCIALMALAYPFLTPFIDQHFGQPEIIDELKDQFIAYGQNTGANRNAAIPPSSPLINPPKLTAEGEKEILGNVAAENFLNSIFKTCSRLELIASGYVR